MQKNIRKDKKTKRKRIVKLFLYICFCLFIVGVGAVFYILQARRPLYISPLPLQVLGNKTSGQDQNTSFLENQLHELHIDYENITPSQGSYTIHLKNKSEVILSARRDIRSQLSSLQFILTRLTMEGRLFNQLDLRFDKPVIRSK